MRFFYAKIGENSIKKFVNIHKTPLTMEKNISIIIASRWGIGTSKCYFKVIFGEFRFSTGKCGKEREVLKNAYRYI